MKKVQGLTLLYTGNGKGKTTAALGLVFRAWGNGLKPGIIQFIKSEDAVHGEKLACQRLDIPLKTLGKGFVFQQFDSAVHTEAAINAWKQTQDAIQNGGFDLLVLDEITYLFTYNWLDCQKFIDWLKENKPQALHLVLTGRNAPQQLIDFADMVSEVKEIKHHYNEQKILAQIGIEF